MCFAPQRRALFRHLNFQKFTLLTWKCASHHNGVHFFDLSTSKNGPNLVCFVHFDLETSFAPQRRALFRHLNFQKWSEPSVFCTFWLGNVLRATTACTFSTSQLQNVRCFYFFYFKMCFAPPRRALFRHLNFQKWSEPSVFCTFWLGNVLRATTACTFSTSQLQKVLRMWSVFTFFILKCASRHHGVQLFLSHLARWLRTRCFSKPTFRPPRPPEPKSSKKRTEFATFLLFLYLFLRTCIVFLLWSSHFFSSPLWLFPPLLFQLSMLSVHVVGSFTSKLASAPAKVIIYHHFRWFCRDLRNVWNEWAAGCHSRALTSHVACHCSCPLMVGGLGWRKVGWRVLVSLQLFLRVLAWRKNGGSY